MRVMGPPGSLAPMPSSRLAMGNERQPVLLPEYPANLAGVAPSRPTKK
jgi:hypothetical protein